MICCLEEPTVVEDESDENVSPKSKRMKRDEEESSDEEEEEDEPVLPKKSVDQSESTKKNSGRSIIFLPNESILHCFKKFQLSPILISIPLDQQLVVNNDLLVTTFFFTSSMIFALLVPSSDITKKKSNAPIGFPTSKIIIPSVQTSRVGLSRKSSVIKSLHPNLNQRIVHE